MKKLFAAFALLLAVALPGAAGARLIVGVNEDSWYEAGAPAFFMPTMEADGLTMNALTLRWDDTQPTAIDPTVSANITAIIAAAQTAGVTVELDLYPLHSQALTDGLRCAPSTNPLSCGDATKIQEFAAWVASVAQAFPTVHEFIVMNECNQPLFVNPQFGAGGLNQSAAVCGRALAAAYDALKAVSPSNFVWGVGLSPRGNDAPGAASNSSTSPVRFLGYLGAWFRAFAVKTHRTAPLMDGFDFHPYPVPQSLPFAKGYANVRDASISNLPRIYQAFYAGFSGTPQRTIGQQHGGGLPVSLNEMGIQTSAAGQPGYTGFEVSANAAGGVVGQYATEAYQATYYKEMLALLSCDPNVQVVNLFHLVDETSLAGWQSGLYWVGTDGPVAKQSAAVVSTWLGQTGGTCQGKLVPWRPAPPVLTAGPKKKSPRRP
jgi:hypothetical protein